MIRTSCALSLLSVLLVVAMVVRPNAITAALCMFVGQPALLAAVALFVLHPARGGAANPRRE